MRHIMHPYPYRKVNNNLQTKAAQLGSTASFKPVLWQHVSCFSTVELVVWHHACPQSVLYEASCVALCFLPLQGTNMASKSEADFNSVERIMQVCWHGKDCQTLAIIKVDVFYNPLLRLRATIIQFVFVVWIQVLL